MNNFSSFYRFLRQNFYNTILFYGFIIGIISGLIASLFYYCLEFMIYFFNDFIAGHSIAKPSGENLSFYLGRSLHLSLIFFILPLFGSLISGLLTTYIAPLAKGNGTDAMINVFHNKKGELSLKDSFVKAIASIFSLSTNCSVGREGPILQICGGIGSFIAKLRKKNTVDRSIFLLAGAAGGLGAIFRAPLGGALTSIEVLYKEDFESEALLPCIVSSVTAYTVFTLIFGTQNIFNLGTIKFIYSDISFYLILGILSAYSGWLLSTLLASVRSFSDKLKIRKWLTPMIGGLVLCIVGFFVPESLGSGSGVLQLTLLGKYSALMLLVFFVAKIITTSFSTGTGISGGIFGPCLVIGALIGGFFAYTVNHFFPGTIQYPSAFIVVGMASFFAGVAHAPIASVIMVCEMTGSYILLPPLLLVSAVSILLSKKGVFIHQVKNRFFSMAHHQESAELFLRQKKVHQIYKKLKQDDIVYNDLNISDFIKLFDISHNSDFIVVDRQGKLVGGISIGDIKNDKNISKLKVSDYVRKVNFVNLEDDLYIGAEKFLNEKFYKIPVVDSNMHVKGFIRYRDIIRIFQNPKYKD